MTIPRFNRLTGLHWRPLCNRRTANLGAQQSQTWISEALVRRAPCAIGKVGTCELLSQ